MFIRAICIIKTVQISYNNEKLLVGITNFC